MSKTTRVEEEEERVIVPGNTYPVKEGLKRLGGRWDPHQKVWTVPIRKAKAARELVDGSAQLTLSLGDEDKLLSGDAASRWLRAHDSKPASSSGKAKRMDARIRDDQITPKTPTTTKERPPWE